MAPRLSPPFSPRDRESRLAAGLGEVQRERDVEVDPDAVEVLLDRRGVA